MNELILIFATVTQTFNLPTGLINSICYVESKYVVKAINVDDFGSDSLGLCQVKLETAQLVGYEGDAFDLQNNPSINAYYAAKYLRRQLDRYGGDVVKGIAAYNAGKFKVTEEGDVLNQGYVDKVMNTWKKHTHSSQI